MLANCIRNQNAAFLVSNSNVQTNALPVAPKVKYLAISCLNVPRNGVNGNRFMKKMYSRRSFVAHF